MDARKLLSVGIGKKRESSGSKQSGNLPSSLPPPPGEQAFVSCFLDHGVQNISRGVYVLTSPAVPEKRQLRIGPRSQGSRQVVRWQSADRYGHDVRKSRASVRTLSSGSRVAVVLLERRSIAGRRENSDRLLLTSARNDRAERV